MTFKELKPWLMATSPTTLTSAFSSVTLGTALAWYLNGRFNPVIYMVTLIALLLAQAGVNMVHDYVDYRTGVDILYRQSGFSHRPSPIIDLGLKPNSVRRVGYALLIIALAMGIYLTIIVGWAVLVLALTGLVIGVGYSEWPLRLHYRGFGEVLAGLAMGPLVTWGSYIVQTSIFTNWAPLLVGVPNGVFTFLILIGSGALEVDACRAVGKLTIVLLVGMEKVKYVVYAAIAVMYASIIASVLLHFLPYISLVSLLLIPSTIRLAGPLLSGDERVVRQRWRELRKLWAGPFSIRLILLIIFIASMIISKLLQIP